MVSLGVAVRGFQTSDTASLGGVAGGGGGWWWSVRGCSACLSNIRHCSPGLSRDDGSRGSCPQSATLKEAEIWVSWSERVKDLQAGSIYRVGVPLLAG